MESEDSENYSAFVLFTTNIYFLSLQLAVLLGSGYTEVGSVESTDTSTEKEQSRARGSFHYQRCTMRRLNKLKPSANPFFYSCNLE